MTVGSGQYDCQGNAVTIANQVALTATLSPICRIWSGQQPPKTARTEQLSTTARDRSIWPSRESQSSNAKWIKSRISSCGQSRNRCQQVMPEPPPTCYGRDVRLAQAEAGMTLTQYGVNCLVCFGTAYVCTRRKTPDGAYNLLR